MKLISSILLIAALSVISSNAFFFGSKKKKDGCNPDPCKNNAKCQVLSINKMLATCHCLSGFYGNTCEKKTGCNSKPCGKYGTCTDDSKDPSQYYCKCNHGYVGSKCQTVDKCIKKNPCKGESVCSLDSKLKPVCKCPLGFIGSKCDKRNCTITEFKGKYFAKGKVYISTDAVSSFKLLDGLANLCDVQVQSVKSFTLQKNPKSLPDLPNAAYYVGHGLSFELKDSKGKKVICDKKCLGKLPIPVREAKCFMDGLRAINWKYSSILPGEIHDGFHLANHKLFNEDITLKQIGCELEKKFPKSNVVRESVGASTLIKCPKGKAGVRCDKVDLCQTKNPCKKGTVCSLDGKFKPVCKCEDGFTGPKCDIRDCSIIEFKGNNFERQPKVFIDATRKNLFLDLDDLAKRCAVIIAPIRSFSLQYDLKDSSVSRDSPFYVGRGLEFDLHDKKGRLLCNSFCLAKNPIPMSPAKCFIDGLANISWKHSVFAPGVIHDGSHIFNPDGYNRARISKQNGCKKN